MSKKVLCFVVAALMLFSLCVSAGAQDADNAAEPVKVACVGDSITYGYNLPDRDTQSYPVLLQEALGSGYDVQNFGVSAYCVLKNSKRPYWELDEYKASLDFAADIVIIMLGTNDIKTENWEAVERNNFVAGKDFFVSDYCDLIDSYKNANPNAKIYVCTPPPIYLDESDEERPPLNLRNYGVPLIGEVAEKTGSVLIDVFTLLDDKAELFEDLLHPNPEGAKIIADAVYEALKEGETGAPSATGSYKENFESIPGFAEPEGDLTRDEFAYLIVNTFELENDPDAGAQFEDISASAYANEIQIAYANGIIKGVSDTEFDPSGKITRQEITVMLYRMWHVLYPEEDFAVTQEYSFSDGDEISDWASEAVVYMYDRKIMLGTSEETPTISPLDNIRRDHSMLLLGRIVETI